MRSTLSRSRSQSRSKRSTRKEIRIPEVGTMFGVNRWFRAMYEKLGWMVLAKAKGLDQKVVEYKRSLKRLVRMIEQLMSEYMNVNRIHDLRVLHMEAKALLAYVNKHL